MAANGGSDQDGFRAVRVRAGTCSIQSGPALGVLSTEPLAKHRVESVYPTPRSIPRSCFATYQRYLGWLAIRQSQALPEDCTEQPKKALEAR